MNIRLYNTLHPNRKDDYVPESDWLDTGTIEWLSRVTVLFAVAAVGFAGCGAWLIFRWATA